MPKFDKALKAEMVNKPKKTPKAEKVSGKTSKSEVNKGEMGTKADKPSKVEEAPKLTKSKIVAAQQHQNGTTSDTKTILARNQASIFIFFVKTEI